jgi:hypothetical protein
MNGFKKLLIKCLDTNENGKLEWSEILYPLAALLIFEIVAGIVANFLYDLIKGIL